MWLWNEWPQKGNVGDVGIDLVAQERATGEFCAIQCKFYLPEHTISKEDIDSFFTASGKSLFTSCIIVSTTDKWGKNAEHALANQSKPVTRLTVHDLDQSPVNWAGFSLDRPQALALRERKTPLAHQVTAIADVMKGFEQSDRVKLVMACGTGKTFTALHRAVAFSRSIKDSQAFVAQFAKSSPLTAKNTPRRKTCSIANSTTLTAPTTRSAAPRASNG